MEQPSISNEIVSDLLTEPHISVERYDDIWWVYYGYDGLYPIDQNVINDNDPRILQKRIREEIDKLKTFDLYLSGIIESRGGDRIEESEEERR